MSAKIQLDMVGHDILLLLCPPLISDSIFGDIATSCWCAGCIEAGDPAIFCAKRGKGSAKLGNTSSVVSPRWVPSRLTWLLWTFSAHLFSSDAVEAEFSSSSDSESTPPCLFL